jgi:hypothetical protein
MDLNALFLENPQLVSKIMALLQNPGMAAIPNPGMAAMPNPAIAALLNTPEIAMSGRNASLATVSAPKAGCAAKAAKPVGKVCGGAPKVLAVYMHVSTSWFRNSVVKNIRFSQRDTSRYKKIKCNNMGTPPWGQVDVPL